MEIKIDTIPLKQALDDLRLGLESTNVSQGFLKTIKLLFDTPSNIELINFEQQTAAGSDDLVLVVKPSDKLLEFTVAVRASKGDLLVSDFERIFHGFYSLPER
jgi:hypothetical protein